MIFFAPALKPNFNKLATLALLAFPTAPPARAATRARYLMGTVCEITAEGSRAQRAIDAAFAEIARLDGVMSLFRRDSELSLLNRRARASRISCSADLFEVLRLAQEVYRLSRGAFDPTFLVGRPALGFARVALDPRTRTAAFEVPTLRVSLDAIGKGYALDAAATRMKALGTRAALLNFGGQILALGAPRGKAAWDIQVGGTPVVLRLRDRSISTSSQQAQPGHLRDPRTGKAVERAGAVVVIGADATRADAWSTALFVSGLERPPAGFSGCAFQTYKGTIIASTRSCGPYLSSRAPVGNGNEGRQPWDRDY